jgi:NAD(P)-dependent dehydrogenase (short-subunit alcohol dehydrogenase family)
VEEKKVAIVTGCSSGIGLKSSKILARNGFYTYATIRNTDKIQETDKSIREISGDNDLPLRIIMLDVNDDTSVHSAIDTIISERQ